MAPDDPTPDGPTGHLSPEQMRMLQDAAAFAARRHEGQRRRDGRTPYASHPVRVTLTVRCLFGCGDFVALCAALLHDVIEDTGADWDLLAERFGPEVADVVAALSKDARLPEDRREPAYDAQLAAGPWQARLIKLADVYDNVSDSVNPKMREKAVGRAHRALAMVDAADPRFAAAVAAVNALLAQSAD